MNVENTCVLKLDHLVFDDLHFRRKGFANKNDVKYRFGFHFETPEDNVIVAHILVECDKDSEYELSVRASGYFFLELDSPYNSILLRQNAAAIVFPYVRSQISILTAQPEVDSVILPPINIAQIIQKASEEECGSTSSCASEP